MKDQSCLNIDWRLLYKKGSGSQNNWTGSIAILFPAFCEAFLNLLSKTHRSWTENRNSRTVGIEAATE